MKVFRIPCLILAAMLVFSLLNSAWLTQRCNGWTRELDAIDQCARQDDWEDAQYRLDLLYQDWQTAQTYLHATIDHEEINVAETLFCRSIVLCQEADSVEFRSHLADLISQLKLLDEMERISIKNIL